MFSRSTFVKAALQSVLAVELYERVRSGSHLSALPNQTQGLHEGQSAGPSFRDIPRNLAGNPNSPQAIIFVTSIIDAIMG